MPASFIPAPSLLRSISNRSIVRVAALAIIFILQTAAHAGTAPPFLSVDINGYSSGGGQTIGPTQAGYQGWEAVEGLFLPPGIDWGNSGAAGLTKVFPTTQGNISVNMIGIAPNSFRGARNRNASADPLSALLQDFVFANRDISLNGFGRHYIRLQLSGLVPNQTYQVTAFSRDTAVAAVGGFQAWADRNALSGFDGPSAWLDASIGPGTLYQPSPGGVLNPIPTLDRSPSTGPNVADPLGYAALFSTVANASGIVTFYTWADPDTFTGVQTASLFNGFQIALLPLCPADIDSDGVVEVDDLLAVINSWGATGASPADIDGSGTVNVDDLLAVINAWGPC